MSISPSQVRVVTTREYLRRRSETFCRVSPAQLHELFTEYEDDIGEQGAACEAMPLYPLQSDLAVSLPKRGICPGGPICTQINGYIDTFLTSCMSPAPSVCRSACPGVRRPAHRDARGGGQARVPAALPHPRPAQPTRVPGLPHPAGYVSLFQHVRRESTWFVSILGKGGGRRGAASTGGEGTADGWEGGGKRSRQEAEACV